MFAVRDINGRVVARSQNLRGIRAYTQKSALNYIERADLFGPNKQGGGTLGITWADGATALVDFASFTVMRAWVDARAKGRGVFAGAQVKQAEAQS